MKNEKENPDIFGMAMKSFLKKGKEKEITVHSPDFDDDIIPVSYLFRSYSEMPDLEKTALKHCSGKVLDVGCGAGSHALYLQEEKKLEVTAIDTSEGAIEICKNRGIKKVRNIAFYDLENERFDTLLFLMNGTGIIGKMKNLDFFFQKCKNLLPSTGQILLDSSDLKYLFDLEEDGGIWMNTSEGYYGEMKYQLSFKGHTSKTFNWLFLDFKSLQLAANNNNFKCELLQKGPHFEYLAKLTLIA